MAVEPAAGVVEGDLGSEPCGEALEGKDEDDLVEKTQAHLASVHPGLEYDRDAILFMAY